MVVLRRRTVLAAGAAGVVLAGCTATDGPAPAPTPAPPPDPLLAELAAENRLLAAYDATLARHPALRPRLTGPRADHAAHATALAEALGLVAPSGSAGPPEPGASTGAPGPGGTTGPSGTPGAGGVGVGPSATAGPVPAVAGAALAALRAAERAAASARGTAALTAPADRAALLAGISASEATHLVVLA